MFGLENIVKTLESEEKKVKPENEQIKKAIRAYIKLRDEVEAIKRRQKKEVKELEEKMQLVADFVEGEAIRQGVDSFATSEGTAYRTTLRAVGVADWDAVVSFVKQNDVYELLQKRVTKSVALEILEQDGVLPPGLRLDTINKFNFKR